MTLNRMFDAGGLDALAYDLPKLGFAGARVMDALLAEGAADLRDAWKRNATATAGQHGKHYPDSIESHRLLGTSIVYEIGPNPDKPQGGMSFENGSVNQPAHNDGKKAADEIVPRLTRRIESALGHLEL